MTNKIVILVTYRHNRPAVSNIIQCGISKFHYIINDMIAVHESAFKVCRNVNAFITTDLHSLNLYSYIS